MKAFIQKQTIFSGILLSFIIFHAQAQTTFVWGKQLGTDKAEYAMNQLVDKKGNIYISGKTTGILAGRNYGLNDAIILKLDSSGNTLWSRQFGTNGDEDEQWSALDQQGNIYITGSTTGSFNGTIFGKEDIFVVKYNPEGQMIWSKQFGSDSADIGKGIFVDNKGFVYVTGSTSGKLGKASLGKTDGFLMKLNNNGRQLFCEQFGTNGDDVSIAITGDNKGTIYVCGTTWGDLAAKNKGLIDVFTGQFTDEGKPVRYTQFGTEDFEIPMTILVDKDKNLYIGGTTSGNLGCQQIGEGDCFLTKIDPSGGILWTNQFGTPKHDGIRSIALNEKISDNILVSGLQNLPPAQAFIRMYKKDGSLVWEKNVFGEGKGDNSGKCVNLDDNGNIYQMGLTMSNLFGSLIGETDIYLVKFNLNRD